MKKKSAQAYRPLTYNPLARIVEREAPASQVLATVARAANLPLQIQLSPHAPISDYAQIDPSLSLDAPVQTASPDPQPGLGYAGLTPAQRQQFLTWLNTPSAAAPLAFQQLYLAQLEVHLLEGGAQAQAVREELAQLQEAPAWQQSEGLARTCLLRYWLDQDGPGLAYWLASATLPLTILNCALGCQALLHEALQVAQLAPVAAGWGLAVQDTKLTVLALRLNSLALHLGSEPLAYALAHSGEAATQPRLWRCNHRALRIALPQPDLRPSLEPLLAELLSVPEPPPAEPAAEPLPEPAAEVTMEDLGWHLILEFGHSRSEFFQFALELAQRIETYTQLADEDRKLIHRVLFKKRDIRLFWRIWDYVQSWSSTRVYLRGEELQKWKIYPYSPYLK